MATIKDAELIDVLYEYLPGGMNISRKEVGELASLVRLRKTEVRVQDAHRVLTSRYPKSRQFKNISAQEKAGYAGIATSLFRAAQDRRVKGRL